MIVECFNVGANLGHALPDLIIRNVFATMFIIMIISESFIGKYIGEKNSILLVNLQ